MAEQRPPGGFRGWLADVDHLAYFVAALGILYYVIAMILGYGLGI